MMEQDRDEMSAVDMDVVASLKELGGDDEPGLFDELVGLFIQESDTHLDNLRDAAGRLAFDEIEVIAHTLKSSSANLGAFGMSELCMELEALGRDGDADRLGPLCERVGTIYRAVREDLTSLRGR